MPCLETYRFITVEMHQPHHRVRIRTGGGVGHKIYTQLMNGVSHMLPFVVGGGILIAIAFLIDGLMVDMNALDVAERSNFGYYYSGGGYASNKSVMWHLVLCFRFWRDLLPWQSVTTGTCTWLCGWNDGTQRNFQVFLVLW